MRQVNLLAVAGVVLLNSTFLSIAQAEPEKVVVPMRDGIELATDIYRPSADGPWPCVLSRSPYNKNGNRGTAQRFINEGFAFVAQDCRGRFESKGEYDPFKTDHHDGFDTVEWIAIDIFAQGTIDNFVGLQANGAGLAAGNQKLIMGPYAHGQLGGRLEFPDGNRGVFGFDHQLRWFNRWLKEEQNGIDHEAPVRYYMMGDTEDADAPGNEWREAKSWPPQSRPTSFFLQPDNGLAATVPSTAGSNSYAYDPQDPVPTVGGGNLISGGKGPMDQRQIKDRQDYLRFQTAVLDAPLEVAGRVTVDLYVESDAPDTDFVAKLVDVYPDGYEALLTDGIIRARYRDGIDHKEMMKPGEVVRVRIDLWSTAIVFNRGHRISLHVTSSNDPRFDPNPNTGRPQRADDETRVALNAIHYSAEHPSRLLLPVTAGWDDQGSR